MVAFARQLGLALGLTALVSSSLGCRPPAADLLARPGVREHLAFTTALGRELYRRDKLEWWASQCARATLSPEQVQTVFGSGGVVVDTDHPDTDVLFFDGEGRVSLVVHCDGDGPESCRAEVPSSPISVSERILARNRAVLTAWTHPSFEKTTEMYHPVVVPAGEGPDVDLWVYMIALDPNPNHVVLGQHYRFVVDPTGTTVKSSRPFAEGGATIDLDAVEAPEGGWVQSVSVWHPLDEVPTEMHVWLAINYSLDLIVATEPESKHNGPPMLWKVDVAGNIAPVE